MRFKDMEKIYNEQITENKEEIRRYEKKVNVVRISLIISCFALGGSLLFKKIKN